MGQDSLDRQVCAGRPQRTAWTSQPGQVSLDRTERPGHDSKDRKAEVGEIGYEKAGAGQQGDSRGQSVQDSRRRQTG
jgi:hypothetical protein